MSNTNKCVECWLELKVKKVIKYCVNVRACFRTLSSRVGREGVRGAFLLEHIYSLVNPSLEGTVIFQMVGVKENHQKNNFSDNIITFETKTPMVNFY